MTVCSREYAAQPQDAALAAFPSDHVDAAFVARDPAFDPATKVLLLDPSSGGLSTRDRFTWATASWCVDELPAKAYQLDDNNEICRWGNGQPMLWPEWLTWKPRGKPYLALHEVGSFGGGFAGALTGDDIADELATIARRHGTRIAHSDQRESLFLTTALSQRGITLHCHTWTSTSKAQAVQLVRRWLADHVLALPPDAQELRRELLGFEEVINASGALTFGARRGGHDDFAALLITLAHAELSTETRLPRSTLGIAAPRGMGERSIGIL